jgi:hypothetical protein
MELNKNEYSYTNSIFEGDINYIVGLIDKEVNSLKKIKENLKRFAFTESKNHSIGLLKFNRIVDEVSRINLEVNVLEQKKIEFIKIKETL